MKKINNKGFVLAETIVVAVFMVTIFTILYANYYPIMANIEKKEYYDDLDGKYIAYWLKAMVEDESYKGFNCPAGKGNNVDATKEYSQVYFFDCNNIDNITKKKTCMRLVKEAGLTENEFCQTGSGSQKCKESDAYGKFKTTTAAESTGAIPLKYVALLTSYNISLVKSQRLNNESDDLYKNLSDGFIDYINLLPSYSNKENNTRLANCRLIIELLDNREQERKSIYKYATIEVRK